MEQFSSFCNSIITIEEQNKPEKAQKAEPGRRPSSTYDTLKKWATQSEKDGPIGSETDKISASEAEEEKSKLNKMESNFWNYGKASAGSTNQFTDKLFEKMVSMVIPTDVHEQSSEIIQERIAAQKNRPMLSVNVMSTNSINLNSRLSWPFYAIDQIIAYLNWDSVSYTFGVLLCITQIVLDPVLVTVLPLVLLLSTLIPHYMAIHTPDQSLTRIGLLQRNPVPSTGKINKAKTPKPVPQFSREFLLNLTDLQNHQVLYIVAYDFFIWLTNDYLYFKDEGVSSVLLLLIVASVFGNLLFGRYVLHFIVQHPAIIKAGCLLWVWGLTVSCHPHVRSRLLEWVCKEETRLHFQNLTNRVEGKLVSSLEEEPVDTLVQQVEIYEVQRLSRSGVWKPVGFMQDFCALRAENTETENTEDTEDNQAGKLDDETTTRTAKVPKKKSLGSVNPPDDWEFVSEWAIDLSHEWVDRNLIFDVVVVDEDEKWVYDVVQEDSREMLRRRRWIRNVRRTKNN